MDVSGTTVLLKDCYFYLLYKRKGDEQTQIPILLDKTYDSATDTISASFEPTSYFTENNGGLDIQVFACSTEQDFVSEDVDIEDVALWTSFNAQISIAKSQLKDSQTIVADDMFTKGIAEMSAYLEAGSEEADAAEEYASDAEEFARGTRSDGLTVPHASTGAHDNAKDYKDLAKDWASKIGGTVESGEYSAKYYAAVADTRSQEAEAYALGTKGGTPVPAFADKNSKDWATKTGSTVDGTNYSSKQYALNAKASADIVEAHATAIDAIYADITNIDAVATDIQDEDSIINTVAENIQDVNAVAESITDVNTVAGKTTQITTVAGISSDVTTVAGIASDVTAVAGIASDVSAVEDIKTDVSAVAAIDADVSAVSAIKDDVSAVATIDDDVTAVATDISDVSAVASDITKVTAVADDLTNIDAVADDLTNIDNAVNYALEAEGFAVGEQNGVPVTSGSPYYENNAKYYGQEIPNLKSAIQGNTARIENLEQEHGGYVTVNYRGTNDVPTGKAKYALVESIVGKSRALNQLAVNGNFATGDMTGWLDASSGTRVISDNKIAYSWYAQYTNNGLANNAIIIANHNYLLFATIKNTYSEARSFRLGQTYGVQGTTFSIPSGATQQIYAIVTPTTVNSVGYYFYMFGTQTADYSCEMTNFGIRDLSIIAPEFTPSGTPSSDLASLLQKIPDLLKWDVKNESLVDTTVSGVEAIGFNRFDEEVELGDIDGNGNLINNSSRLRWKNYISINPNTSYYYKSATNDFLVFYDANKNFISTTYRTNNTFTSPATAMYMKVAFNGSYGTTYNHDCCLNFSQTNTSISPHNGDYVPYMTDTLSLSTPVTLRSAGSVADTDELNVEVLVDGHKVNKRRQTKNVGTYNLGDVTTWTLGGSYNNLFYVAFSSIKSRSLANITCALYETKTYEELNVNDSTTSGIAYRPSDYTLRIKDPSCASSSQLITKLAGQIMNYELANPVVTILDPIIDNTILTEGGGTINTIQNNVYPDESPAPTIDNSMDVGYLAL